MAQKDRRPSSPDDDSVEVTRVSAIEAELVAAQLRGAGIRAGVLGVGTGGELAAIQFTYGSRVMVRRSDFAAAQRVLAQLPGEAQALEPIGDDELGALAEKSAGWSDPETGAVV
jgi:hypothetical protein